MTGVGDLQDSTIKVTLNGTDVATGIPVNNAAGSDPNDEAGTASVSFTLPAGVPGGTAKLHVKGATTGTDVIVPIQITAVEPATRDIQIIATNDFHGRIANDPGRPRPVPVSWRARSSSSVRRTPTRCSLPRVT